MNDPVISQMLVKILFLYGMYRLVKMVLKMVGIDFDKPKYYPYPKESLLSKSTQTMFKFLLTGPFKFLAFLFNFEFEDNPKNAFMSGREKRQFLNPSNKGLLLDGSSSKISDNVSFEHMAVIGRAGAGKSSKLVIPNIFTIDKASIVVTDLSGELFEKTSGYMKKKGFKIQVLNLADVNSSLKYNPLYYATSSEKISELAQVLVKSANPNPSANDSFWLDGAEQIIRIIISCLIETRRPEYINLANVRHLLNNFGGDGENIKAFVNTNASDIIWSDFQGFLSASENTIRSMISTALNSLNALSNDAMVELTLENTINFDNLREEKTILYLIVPQEKMEFYSFLINTFYTQLFHSLMKDRDSSKLPVYLLLDEFGHLKIPNFSTIITTIRKYRVSISIFLQSVNQLNSKYGQNEANVILDGGISSKLFLSGADNTTTMTLEKMLGTYRKKYKEDNKVVYRDTKIMTAEQIRTIEDNQAIYIYANKKPVILDIKPYFKSGKFKRFVRNHPVNIAGSGNRGVQYVRL